MYINIYIYTQYILFVSKSLQQRETERFLFRSKANTCQNRNVYFIPPYPYPQKYLQTFYNMCNDFHIRYLYDLYVCDNIYIYLYILHIYLFTPAPIFMAGQPTPLTYPP